MRKITYLSVAFVLGIISACSSGGNWENLIEKDLSNWVQLNGEAVYRIDDGVITGTTVINTPNSFLCSKENYSDFILEFETWFDPQMNSGVQIRSESRPDYKDGRVHGYQVEMDPSERAWSGGIYDEARRGWLYTLENNPAGKKALKVGEWNLYRVEASGNSIRTWINGIPCADLLDEMTPSGFIALQVHSVGDNETKAGLVVKWKNIRIMTTGLEKHLTPYAPLIPQVNLIDNTLSQRETEEGWKLLFDGTTPGGWMNAKSGSFPQTGWEIKNGTLIINPEAKGENGGGDIVTTGKFKDFELIVDFNYKPGANSGIKYFVDTEINDGALRSIGCEYQILDDKIHPDARAGISGNHTLAGLYDLIPPVNIRDNGPDMWNRARIVVKGNKVQHWLNEHLTVEYERGTPEWKELISKSKFKDIAGFGETVEGRILLQDHGDMTAFKNIKIREIR